MLPSLVISGTPSTSASLTISRSNGSACGRAKKGPLTQLQELPESPGSDETRLKLFTATTGNGDNPHFDQAAEFNDTVRAEDDFPIGGRLDDLSGFLARLVGVLQLPDKGVRIENVTDFHRYLPGASVGLVRSAPSLIFNTSRA